MKKVLKKVESEKVKGLEKAKKAIALFVKELNKSGFTEKIYPFLSPRTFLTSGGLTAAEVPGRAYFNSENLRHDC